ncbi:GIY-YIG nuclease family protein [Candidatus Gottesmanbacteria bacterium]|nr:GIY-YIG nuclease family protein [Candidatus Gottesmanbacteria bacterium]
MIQRNSYFVYIATNRTNRVLYTGVTNNLIRRLFSHKNKLVSSFTSKYNIQKLVYYEMFADINEAIIREKQIKGGSRQKKLDLIKSVNPNYNDLYEDIIR